MTAFAKVERVSMALAFGGRMRECPPADAWGAASGRVSASIRYKKGSWESSGMNSRCFQRPFRHGSYHGAESQHEGPLHEQHVRMRALWQSVAVQMLVDAVSKNPFDKWMAEAWLQGKQDMQMVMDLANLSLGFVQRFGELEMQRLAGLQSNQGHSFSRKAKRATKMKRKKI